MVMSEHSNYAMRTCFGLIGLCDRNRNCRICIASNKVAKMSTILVNITHDFTKKTLQEQEHVPFKCRFLLKEVGNGVKPFGLI